MVLKIPTPIHPVDARTIVAQPFPQCGADPLPERPDFGGLQGLTAAERMEPGSMKSLVRIDIAQSGDRGLIQQQRLQGPFVPTENQFELLDLETLGQRFRTKSVEHGFGVRHEKYPTELPGVAEAELRPGGESKDCVIVRCPAGSRRSDEKIAAHHKVDKERIPVQRYEDELAPTIDPPNGLPRIRCRKLFGEGSTTWRGQSNRTPMICSPTSGGASAVPSRNDRQMVSTSGSSGIWADYTAGSAETLGGRVLR